MLRTVTAYLYVFSCDLNQAARLYIETMSSIIARVLQAEAQDSAGRGRRRRQAGTEDALSRRDSNRRKRQAGVASEETIRARVTEAFLLEWDIATVRRR